MIFCRSVKNFRISSRVIADGRDFDALLFESRHCALQLDQLPFAVRSPICGTEKEQNRAVRSFQRIEGLYPAKLVASEKAGAFCPTASPIDMGSTEAASNRISLECPSHGHGVSQVSGYRSLQVKLVHDPGRIVDQRQLRPGLLLEAIGHFGKSFVCIASAGHQDARP